MKQLALAFLLFGLIAQTGCSRNPKRTEAAGEQKSTMSNSDLENRIKDKLTMDPQLRAADLKVNADMKHNEVTLSGAVNSESERDRAVEMVKSSWPGVTVQDKIDVKP